VKARIRVPMDGRKKVRSCWVLGASCIGHEFDQTHSSGSGSSYAGGFLYNRRLENTVRTEHAGVTTKIQGWLPKPQDLQEAGLQECASGARESLGQNVRREIWNLVRSCWKRKICRISGRGLMKKRDQVSIDTRWLEARAAATTYLIWLGADNLKDLARNAE